MRILEIRILIFLVLFLARARFEKVFGVLVGGSLRIGDYLLLNGMQAKPRRVLVACWSRGGHYMM